MYYFMTSNRGKLWRAHTADPPTGFGGANEHEVKKWADSQSPPLDLKGDFPSMAVVFFDKRTFADYCRLNGVMLFATEAGLTGIDPVSYGGQEWVAPRVAVAVRPEDEGPKNPAGITSDFSLLWVPRSLFETMSSIVKDGNEDDDIYRVSSRSVKRAFVYLDISGFSKYPPGQEALIINTLVRLTSDVGAWMDSGGASHQALESVEAQLCIGDGYIYVFPDALKATLFASWMAELIQQLVAHREQNESDRRRLPVSFHFRIGIHYGPVYRFWDPGRKSWNYIGDGINGGNRVLSVIDKKYDDVVFISDAVANEFIARAPHDGIYKRVRNCLESRGRQEDKHGKGWRVFLLNHTKLCEEEVQSTLAKLRKPE